MSTEYLELRYFNNTTVRTDAILTNQRTFPFISADKKYTTSVVRFDADNKNVPMFIPQISKPKVDIAYDENGDLRNEFGDTVSAFLRPYGTQHIQYGGDFDVFGDYIAFCTAPINNAVINPVKSNTVSDGYYIGVWNHKTGVNLWVDHLTGLYIGPYSNYSAVFESVEGCKFSSDGTKINIIIRYKIYVNGTYNNRYLSYLSVDTQYGGSVTTANLTTDYLGSPTGEDVWTYCFKNGYFLVSNGGLWGLWKDKAFIRSDTHVVNYAISALDMVISPQKVLCVGDIFGLCKIWVAVSGDTFTLNSSFNVASGHMIEYISISPDGQFIIIGTLELDTTNQNIVIVNKSGALLGTFNMSANGYLRSITWKTMNPSAIVTDMDQFKVVYTFNSGNNSVIKIYDFILSGGVLTHDEIYSTSAKQLAWKSNINITGDKLITSYLDPVSYYSDESFFKEVNVDFLNAFDKIPPKWSTFVTPDRRVVRTNLQFALEYNKTPLNTTSGRSMMVNYVNWENPQNDLVGYGSTLQSPEIITEQVVLGNDFFYCYDLQHVAKLFQKTLQYIFQPLKPFFTTGQNVTCEVISGKLAIVFPQNAFDMDFRIIISQSLHNIVGFHSVPHETLPQAFVIVIKKDVMQRYTDGSRWIITELFRPSLMFPFKTILFTSTDFKCRPVKRFNNSKKLETDSAPILTDLLLTVDDANAFYDTMTYAPQSYNRIINIDNTTHISDITIRVLLETSNGFQVPLYLNPLSTCGMLLKINSQ
jgi:hypothetical protein